MSDILEQIGYLNAAQAGALDEEQKQHVATPDMSKLSLAEIAALGRGARAYLDDYYALRDANAFDYTQAGLGGFVGGLVGGTAALGGMVAGGAIDLAAALNPLSDIPTNFAGTLSSYGQGLGDGLKSLINNNEQEAIERAIAARTQARSAYEEAMYQQDLASGMDGFTAGIRDIGRGLSSGIDTFLDNGINTTDLAGNAIGQLAGSFVVRGGASAAIKGLGKIGTKAIQEAVAKTAAKKAGVSLGDRAADALALGGMEAAGQMVQANEELANISDVDLYANSADFRAYVQEYKDMGLPDADALKYGRIKLARDVGLANAAAGGGVAFLAAGATTPLRHISMARGLRGMGKASVAEGTEEAITGFGQSTAGNYIAQDYDPDRRLTEGTGQEIALSAILGGIAGGTGATPFAVRNSLASAQASLAQRKEARQAKKQALEAQKAALRQAALDSLKEEEKAGKEGKPSPESIEASQTSDSELYEETLPTGEKTYIPKNKDYYKLLDINSAEEAKKAGVPQKNGRIAQLDNLLNEYNKAPKGSKERVTARDAFLNRFDTFAENTFKNQDIAAEAKEKYGFKPEIDANYTLGGFIMAAAKGEKVDLSGTQNKELAKQSQALWDKINFLSNQATILTNEQQAEQAKVAKSAANTFNGATEAQVQEITKGLAENTLNASNPDVEKTILKIRNKPNKTKTEKTLLSVYDLVKAEEAAGLAKPMQEGAKRVIRNINTVTDKVTGRVAVKDMTTDIKQALLKNDSDALAERVKRLNLLADSHRNKLVALQEALVENDSDTEYGYQSYRASDLKPYSDTIQLSSLPFYDQVVREQQQLNKITNSINSLVKEYDPDIDWDTVTDVAPLENEEELKENYKAKRHIKDKKPVSTALTGLAKKAEEIEKRLAARKKKNKSKPVKEESSKKEPVKETPNTEVEDSSQESTAIPQEQTIENTEQEAPLNTEEQPIQKETASKQPTQERTTKKQTPQEKVTEKQSTQQKQFTQQEAPQQEEAPSTTQEENEVTDKDSSSLVQEEQKAPQQKATKNTQKKKDTPQQKKATPQQEEATTTSEESTESTPTNSQTQEKVEEDTTTTPTEEVQENASESIPEEFKDVVGGERYTEANFKKLADEAPTSNRKAVKDINKDLRKGFRPIYLKELIKFSRKTSKALEDALPQEGEVEERKPIFETGTMPITNLFDRSKADFDNFLANDLKKTESNTSYNYSNGIRTLRDYMFKPKDEKNYIFFAEGDTIINTVASAEQYKNILINDNRTFNREEFLKIVEENSSKKEEPQKNLLPQNIIRNFVANFTTFTNSVLQNDYKDDQVSLNNLGIYAEQKIDEQTPISRLVLGVQLNDQGELDFSKVSSQRMLLLWTDKQANDDRIHFNETANAFMSLATLRVMQKLEQRIMTRSDEQIEEVLESQGLNSTALLKANEEEKTKFQIGTDRNSIINDIAHEFMDLANLKNNNAISMSFDGEMAATVYAQLAYQFLVEQGYIVDDVFHFAKNPTSNEEAPEWIPLSFRSTPKGDYKKYWNNPDAQKVSFMWATPVMGLRRLPKQTDKINPIDFSVLPRNSAFNDDIDILLHPEPELTEYYSVEDMPPVQKTMLHTDGVPLKEKAITALENRRKTPHYLDPDMAALYKMGGFQGILNLYDIDTAYNKQYALTVNGKKQSLRNELDAAMNKVKTAVLYDPTNPKYYNDYTVNKIGRIQERASYSDQASKIVRALFSNAKTVTNTVPTSIEQENALLGFKAAVLQAYGVKVKNATVQDIEEGFAKVEDQVELAFSAYDYDLYKMDINEKSIVDFAKEISKATGKSFENAPLGLLATVNMLRYMQAKTQQKSFVNTLTIEGDGSCNGYFNSHLVMNCSDNFTLQSLRAYARSNYYVGDDDTTVVKEIAKSALDNYTANAQEASNEISARARDANTKRKYALQNGDKNSPYYQSFPYKFMEEEEEQVSISTIFSSVFDFLAAIDSDSISFNEAALKGDATNDALNSSNVLGMGRAATKNPTTRINYGQGKGTNALEIWHDLSDILVKKISNLVENSKTPPYKVWFAKELQTGELNEDQAYNRFIRIAKDFEILNKHLVKENARGEITFKDKVALRSNQKTSPVLPSAFYLPKDAVMTKNQREELYNYSPKDLQSYTDAFLDNLAYCYADILFKVIDEARSTGFKDWMDYAAPFTQTMAAIHTFLVKRAVNEATQKNGGILPSVDEYKQIKRDISRKFPSVIRSHTINLDPSKQTNLAVSYNLPTEEKQKQTATTHSTRLKNATVVRGPATGRDVINDLSTPIEQRVLGNPGIAIVADAVIGNGDGNMQVNLFNKEGTDSFVDRYDGVDIPSSEYFTGGGGQLLNEAVYDTLENAPIVGFATNAVTAEQSLKEIVEEDPDGEIFNYIHEVFQLYSPIYRRYLAANRRYRYDEELYKPQTKEELIDATMGIYARHFQGLNRNNFANNAVLRSMPATIAHMSAGPTELAVRDPRDHFRVPQDWPESKKEEAILQEMNRRKEWLMRPENYSSLYENFRTTGKIELPKELFEDVPRLEAMEELTSRVVEPKATEIIIANPQPTTRELPNTRTNESKEIAPTAPLTEAPARQTTQVQAGSTAISTTGKQSDEVQDYINKFLESKQLPKNMVPIARNFFNRFLNTGITKHIRVYKVEKKNLSSLGYTQDFTDTSAFYDPNKRAIYLIKDSLTEQESPEVFVHELIHAISAAAIADAYLGSDKAAKARVERLLDLADEFVDILDKRDIYLAKDFQEKILDLKNPVERAQEFVAYMLTHPEYIKYAQENKPAKPYLARIFQKFTQLLTSLFGIRTKNELKAYLTFYGETAGITAIILEESQYLANVNSLTEAVQGHPDGNLVRLAAKIDDTLFRLEINSTKKAEYQASNKKVEGILNELDSNNVFKLDRQQKVVAAALASLYGTAIDLDSNAKIDALNFKETIMSKLKVEHLAYPEDINDTMLSEARYQLLAGNDVGSSLGLFMALAAVSPELRQSLNKLDLFTKQRQLGANRVVNANTSTMDDFISFTGTRILNYLNDISLTRNKEKGVVEQVDSLVDNLLRFRRRANTYTPANIQWQQNIEEPLSNKIDSAANTLLEAETLKKWATSNSFVLNSIAKALKVTVPFLMNQDSAYYQRNKRKILAVINRQAIKNPGFFSRFFTTAFRELMSTDATADVVYQKEKQAKAVIQAIRTSWREIVPRELHNKFSQEGLRLNTRQSSALNRVILQADLGTLSNEMINSILSKGLASEIAVHRSALTPQAAVYSKQLAHYMVTGVASNGMLRNAHAIASFSYKGQNLEQKTKIIDEYVTLLALQENKEAFELAQEIYAKAPNAFIYSVDQQRANRNEELKKIHASIKNDYNYYKGYYPQTATNATNIRVIPFDSIPFYKSLGYKVKGYTDTGDYAYIESTLNPMSTFNQGALQSIINQTGGIDAVTGLSPNTKVYTRIRNKNKVEEIKQNLSRRKPSNEAFIPILNSSGTSIVGYEVTVDPMMYRHQRIEQDFAKNLGAWRGRQIEEQLASESNKELIKELKEQYENASSYVKGQFVDLIKLSKTDPIVRDALNNLSPQTLIDISGKPFLPEEFYVRQDLIPDIIGRRQASIIDLATGNTYWSPKVQQTLTKMLRSVAGPKAFAYLYRGETLIKNLTSSARNFIVIRSGEVMLFNLFSNFMSLVIRGVPIQDIVRLTPRITKELEQFNKIRQKQVLIEMAINAEKGKEHPSAFRIKTLQNRLREQKEAVDLLTYSRDLLKAGEYNTIADLGDVNDDILLSTGRWGEYLESKVNLLPNALKEVGRQLIITKDTAIYRMLEKGTRYGDFIAKAILYRYLQENKRMPKDKALSKVRYEYVNYDMLPGRTREYLENMGLLWFYNYKLRIARTAMSMLKENPLASLLYMVSPISIGTPITDNVVVNILSGAGSSVGLKLFDLPWFNNQLWLNIFG